MVSLLETILGHIIPYLSKKEESQMWWSILVMPALRRQKQGMSPPASLKDRQQSRGTGGRCWPLLTCRMLVCSLWVEPVSLGLCNKQTGSGKVGPE